MQDRSISALREETPGCSQKVHLNNAGASLMPTPVIDAMTEYIRLESITGGYETADLKAAELAGYYSSMAQLLHAQPKNIAFTSSATNSFSRALSAIPFEPGDKILIAREDYISNQISFLSLQQRTGIQLIRARSLPSGGVDLEDMERLMDEHKPRLVSLSHIPTNSGLIQPAEKVGALCAERQIPYLLDACQSVGQMPLDVSRLKCDFLTGTFRKFMRGPRGAGFLFVSDNMLARPWGPLFLDMRAADWTGLDTYRLRDDARRYEDWELPYALVAGARASADYARGIGLEAIEERNTLLASHVRTEIKKIGLTPLDRGNNLASIITVHIHGQDPAKLLQHLRKLNINTSIASRSSAIPDFDDKGVAWALRISPHYYNTTEEIDCVIAELKRITSPS